MENKKNKTYITFNDLTVRMKYKYEKNYKYNGQLKLLFSTLNFLIDNVKPNDTILYIGSGKGYNIPIIVDLFNSYNLNWNLYDPNGHCFSLENNGSININNKIFNISEAKKFAGIPDLVFISDIRTVASDSVKTRDLIENYKFQNSLLDYMNPRVSCLKWRCPFPDDWIEDVKIPIGEEFLQPYAAKFSNEMRLVCSRPYTFRTIDNGNALAYEELLFYYNKVLRHKNDTLLVEYILNKLTEDMKKKIKVDNVNYAIEHFIDLIEHEKYL